jgi:hypothetical protein
LRDVKAMTEVSELTKPAEYVPPVLIHEGVHYVPATAAQKYLGCHYSTVLNLINSHKRRLVGKKIESTLYVTADSLEAEKKRRNTEAAAKAGKVPA